MKRFITSITATMVLVTGLSAATIGININHSNKKIKIQNNINKTELLNAVEAAALQHYIFRYLGNEKKVSVKAFKAFSNPYDTLVHHRINQFGGDFGTTLASTIFNDSLLYDNGDFNNLKYSHILQYQFIDSTIEIMQAKGIPTNLTYALQKIVDKNAVTLTLNIPQILAKYAKFLMYLKNLSANDQKKFNQIFQKFAIFLYYNKLIWYKNLPDVPARVISLTDKLTSDPFCPDDFIAMIIGDYRGYSRTFLAKHRDIAKFVNYVLTDQRKKAAELFLKNKKIEEEKNFYFNTVAAAAKIEDRFRVPFVSRFSWLIFDKTLQVLNSLPPEYKQHDLELNREGIFKIIEISKRIVK